MTEQKTEEGWKDFGWISKPEGHNKKMTSGNWNGVIREEKREMI